MKKFLLLIICLVTFVFANVDSPTITEAEYDKFVSESADFLYAEKELNDAYKKVTQILDQENRQKLKRAQIEWIEKRDKDAFDMSDQKKGSEEYLRILTQITQERTVELLKYAENAESRSSNAPQNLQSNGNVMDNMNNNTATNSAEKINRETNGKTPLLKFLFVLVVALLIVGIPGIIKGLKGDIIVYTSFTDAAVSVFGIWGAVLAWILMQIMTKFIFETDGSIGDLIPAVVFYSIFIGSLLVGLKASYYSNSTPWKRLLSICAKLSTTLVYAFYVIGYFVSSPNAKQRSNETEAEYLARIQREERNHEAAKRDLLIATIVVSFLAYKLSVKKRFIAVGEYLSFKGFTQEELDASANEENEKLTYFRENIPSKWWTNWLFKYMQPVTAKQSAFDSFKSIKG